MTTFSPITVTDFRKPSPQLSPPICTMFVSKIVAMIAVALTASGVGANGTPFLPL